MKDTPAANFGSIPIFDLSEFENPDPAIRNNFITQLRTACHDVGFFYIRNTGMNPQLIADVEAVTREFFDLPQNEKDSIRISDSPHFRGYGRLGEEVTLGVSDYKETLDLGLEQPRFESDRPRYLCLRGPNQWPVSFARKDSRSKDTLVSYISEMQALGERLMMAMALTLGLPEDHFRSQFSSQSENAYVNLRLLRYPPARNSSQTEFGVGPHIDSGCLVILLQDDVGGLQVQNSEGKWMDASPIPNTFVVNIGKMLQLWSNNYFVATPHRVTNSSSRIRHSIPFFFEPNLDTVVVPLAHSLKNSRRPPLPLDTKVIYGDYMLTVFERSFPK